ncbi:LTA synthase family protein [Georgenia subflava]|uniref:Sulfatase-like hydrolase/transferase n=1 Tax=Georgenia subflava TaxID=1622177 RepID=A0A6N7EE25_9MICO|nr:LTA synthase family protein [Georgenia subflava]MPV35463.1 sulfatase-like hydrolase/transferase [Georgenia subflava]
MPETTALTLEPSAPSEAAVLPVEAPGGPSPARSVRRAVLLLASTAVVAVVVAYGLEWAHALNDPWLPTAERLALMNRELFALGALVVWAVLVLLLALTGRLWIAVSTTVAVAAVIGFADHQKMQIRGEPLYPSDAGYLGQLGLLVESVGTGRALALAGAVVLLPVLAWAIVALVRRLRPAAAPRPRRRYRYALRAAAGLLAGAVLVSASSFNQPGSVLRGAYDDAGATWAPWNQRENYAENTFIGGLLYNLPAPPPARPAGYGEARMAELAAEYRALAETVNASRDPSALDDTNVVVVLSESFSDPARMRGVDLARDPIPFTRDLMSRTTSGTMLSSGFGGGTSNVEFEVLTGMAVRNFGPQLHTPFQMLLPRYEEFPSFVSALGEPGRATATVHPYHANFYRRDAVYPALGFAASTFLPQMSHADRIGNDTHVSDSSTFREVVDELRASDRPLLLNVVTMQNHGPMTDNYSDPIGVAGPFSDAAAGRLGQYLRGLEHSDEALAELVGELEAMDERTIVLVYGDHLPATWPDSVLNANGATARYETPWFVYANFETEKIETGGPLGPTFLLDRLLATADAPVTPYSALLGALSQEVAALEPQMMLGPGGKPVLEEDLSARAAELLADYRMVQYDLSVGERYAVEEMFEVPGADS